MPALGVGTHTQSSLSTHRASGGCPPSEAELFQCQPARQEWHEHWTNIHRMKFLAERHPQIERVWKHKESKSFDPSCFDSNGRAEAYHQAPFDQGIGLAASGAEMWVGVTANKVQTLPTFPRWRGPSSLTSAGWPRRSQTVLSAA